MDPLYESKDIQPFQWKQMLGIISGILVLMLPALTHDGGWDSIYAIAGLSIFGLLFILGIIISIPQSLFQIYHDHLLIRYGIAFIFKNKILVEDVISIQDASDWPLMDRSRWTGWGIRNRATRLDSSILAIETIRGNYIIGCPFIHEAMAALNGVLSPGKVMYQRRDPIAEQSEWSDGEEVPDLPKDAWRPNPVKMHSQPGVDDSKPVKEIVRGSKFAMIVIAGLFALTMLVPVLLSFGRASVFGTSLFFIFLVIPMLIFSIVIFLVITRFLMPFLRILFYRDRIEFLLGLIFPLKFALQMDRIESIRPVRFDPMTDFEAFFGIRNGKGRWEGWTGVIASVTNKGIAIESSEQNVVFSCNAAEEVSKELKELLGGK